MQSKDSAPILERFQESHLKELAQRGAHPLISIYLPTHERGRDVQQGPIRLKNLLGKAESKLLQRGGESGVLDPIRSKVNDRIFWEHQGQGLSIFLATDFVALYRLRHSVEESVVVDEIPFMKPLVAECSTVGSDEALVLTLSWDEARLYRITPDSLEPLESDHFPVTFEDLVLPRDTEEQLQYQSYLAVGNTANSSTAMYHGHGEGESKIEGDRSNYLARVGQLTATEVYQHGLPLMIVATKEVSGHFEALNDLSIHGTVAASPTEQSEKELFERVSAAMAKLSSDASKDFLERFGTALSNRQASADIGEIATAALQGRVRELVVASDEMAYGHVSADGTTVERSGKPDSVELTNFAVVETLKKGGRARSCPMAALPDQSSVAAAIYYY